MVRARKPIEPLLVKQKTAARLCDVTPRQIREWEAAGIVRSETVGTTKLYPYHQFKRLAGMVRRRQQGGDGASGEKGAGYGLAG